MLQEADSLFTLVLGQQRSGDQPVHKAARRGLGGQALRVFLKTRRTEPCQSTGRFQTGRPGHPAGERYLPEWIGCLPLSNHGQSPNRQHQLPLEGCRLVKPFEP